MSLPAVFDFFPAFIDFNVWLAEDAAWQVVNGDVYNINNMSEEELRQSIIDDVLAVTIWEKQTGQSVKFDVSVLCRYLTPEQRTRVEQAMLHEEISGLFDPHLNEHLRILDNKEVLETAMQYCGVWFTGYNAPDGLIRIQHDNMQKAIEAHGGLDGLATALAMEFNATHSSTKTVN